MNWKYKIGDDKCPACGSFNLLFSLDRAENTCADCGLVVEERMIDHGQNRRVHDHHEVKSRGQEAPLTDGSGFITRPRSTLHVEGKGTNQPFSLSLDVMNKYKKLQRLEQKLLRREFYKQVKSHPRACELIDHLAFHLSLPKNVVRLAKDLYWYYMKRNCIKGRKVELVAVGCLHYSCKKMDVSITRQFWEERIDKWTWNFWEKGLKKIKKLNQQLTSRGIEKQDTTRRRAGLQEDAYARSTYSQKRNQILLEAVRTLDLNAEVHGVAREILVEFSERGLTSGRRAAPVVGCALIFACEKVGIKVQVSKVAKAVKTSRTSLSSTLAQFRKELNA